MSATSLGVNSTSVEFSVLDHAVLSLSRDEVESILAEKGKVVISNEMQPRVPHRRPGDPETFPSGLGNRTSRSGKDEPPEPTAVDLQST